MEAGASLFAGLSTWKSARSADNRTMVVTHHKTGTMATLCALMTAFMHGQLEPFVMFPTCVGSDYELFVTMFYPDFATGAANLPLQLRHIYPLLQCQDDATLCMSIDEADIGSLCSDPSKLSQWEHFVHMVRDPVELVISDYQYTRRAAEHWAKVPPSSATGTEIFGKCGHFNYFSNFSEAEGVNPANLSAADFLHALPIEVGVRAVGRHVLRTQIRTMILCKARAEALVGATHYSEMRLEDTAGDYTAFVRRLYGKLGIPSPNAILRDANLLNQVFLAASSHASDHEQKAELMGALRADAEMCPQLQAAQRALGYPAMDCAPGSAAARTHKTAARLVEPAVAEQSVCEADMGKWLFAFCVEDGNCPLELIEQRGRRPSLDDRPTPGLIQADNGGPLQLLIRAAFNGGTPAEAATGHSSEQYLRMARASGLRFRREQAGASEDGTTAAHWVPLSDWGDPVACARLNASQFCTAFLGFYRYGFCIPASCSANDTAAKVGELLLALTATHRHDQFSTGRLSQDELLCQEDELAAHNEDIRLGAVGCCAVLILLALPWLLQLRGSFLSREWAFPQDRRPTKSNPIVILDGLRVLSISSVVFAHMCLHDSSRVRPGDDFEEMAHYNSPLMATLITSGLYAVQCCLFLSALLSWLKLSQLARGRQPSLRTIVGTILVRAARLWPGLVLALALFPWLLTTWSARFSLKTGRLASARDSLELIDQCNGAGWLRTALFLPNFGLEFGRPLDAWCLPHTWFLAVDLQAYVWVMLTAMVVGSRIGPRAMAALLATMLSANTLLTGYLAVHFQLHQAHTTFDMIRTPGVLMGKAVGGTQRIGFEATEVSTSNYVSHEAFDHSVFFTATWPVAMGIASAHGVSGALGPAGRRMFGLDDNPAARLRATGCLLLALFLVSWPVGATAQCAAGFDEWHQFFNTADVAAFRDGHELSHRWNISYLGQVLGYPSLSVGLAMLVVLTHLDAPACGLATAKRFLSHGIFRVLAPWTFMVYIVHEPLYIVYSALTTANLRPYNPCSNMVERLGFLALMFVIAGPLHVVFERPWGPLVIAKLETLARGRIEGWAHVPGAEKTEAVAMGLRGVDVSAVVENDDGDQPPTSKQKLARAG